MNTQNEVKNTQDNQNLPKKQENPDRKNAGQNIFYWIARNIVKALCWIFFPMKVIGADKVPANGPVLVCCNHVSFMDAIYLACALKRRVTYLAKKELFKNPIMNWILRGIGMVPVDRGASDIQAMRTCMEVLKEGRLLGIFPQGHRYKDDSHRELQNGAAMMALRARPTVVAVHVSAAAKLLRRVTIRISDPVDLSDIVRVNAQGLQEANLRIAGAIWQEEK